jgi:RNA polymerase-binding transcription factor DksA
MKEHTAQFEEHAARLAALTADWSGERAARERAMAALDLYRAREAIEEIESALVRIEDGSYGTCQSCERPI